MEHQKLFELIKKQDFDTLINILEEDIDNFIDVNVRDEHNNYLLTYSILYNNIKFLQLLVKKGARIDITDNDERSILFLPIKYDFYNIVKYLVDINKDIIGVSILDIRDKNYNIPLHYAITFNNYEIVDLLLKSGSNPNQQDKYGNNSLHLAIYNRNQKIIEKVIEYIVDVNSKTYIGESVLHIASNLQLVDVVKYLLNIKELDVNVQDYEHEITALHYAINLGNREVVKILLNKGANPNIQDAYGNTALHYSASEENFEFFNEIIKSSQYKINYNLWNIDSKLPLHLVINFPIDISYDFIKLMLPLTNVNIQDNNGDTCLHLMCKFNIWKNFSNTLEKKRLDLTIKNKNNMTPYDYIKDSEKDEFLNMIVNSYMFRLKINKKKEWEENWENICKYELNEITDEEKLKIINIKRKTDDEFIKSCKDTIKKKIMNTLKNLKENNKCSVKTFPRIKGFICPFVESSTSNIDVCTFTGSTLDVLIGLIFLLKKHKNSCSTVNKEFRENNELCKFYRTIGITINSQCEFLNFEIVWVFNKLYFSKDFSDYFNKCINNNNKRFIIIPIGIELKEGSHANYLIYDKKTNEIERFEPHGSSAPVGLNYNPNLLDKLLKTRFQELIENIIYISPKDYLPKIGFQMFDIAENKRKRIGDPGGFCALWAIWYVDMRLTYTDISRKNLVNKLISNIKENNIQFRNLIRNYSSEIIKIRDTILKKNNTDINDWLMEQSSNEQINDIIKDIIIEINSIQ